MSYLETISSSNSTNLSGEFHSPKINKSKTQFGSKYDKLLRQISDLTKRNRDDLFTSKVEKEHLKTFSSNISTRKENPLKDEIFKAKFSLLSGKTLDSLSYTTRNNIQSPAAKPKVDNLFVDNSINRNNTFRELKNYLKKKGDISFQSKLLRDNTKKEKNTIESYTRSNNSLVSKIKQTFPEYINLKTKGQSFIGSTSTSNQKLNQLRNQLNKI